MNLQELKKEIIEIMDRDIFNPNQIKDRIDCYLNSIKVLTKEEVVVFASMASNANVDDMYSSSRKREAVNARKMYYWYFRIIRKKTLEYCGEEFGQDHATVKHSLNKLSDDLFTRFKPTMDVFRKFNILINN